MLKYKYEIVIKMIPVKKLHFNKPQNSTFLLTHLKNKKYLFKDDW